MQGEELRRLRLKMKLTQAQLAVLVGVAANSIARFERSEINITEPVARLVRLLAQDPRVFAVFKRRYGKKSAAD
jgi:transcriptional regulator with XRE-family HTH domain